MSNETRKTLPKYRPATDIIEGEDGYAIVLDVPGLAREDLVIDLNKQELVISGKTGYPAEPEDKGDRKYTHVEFGGCEYRRTFTLSDTVDREKISAKLENGILFVSLPKAEKAKPKRIEITE
ncbi:MAG: Hsp20/alpha crystallin family protein [Desulfovibrio sp.]|nr:MAG: Hsp20/alpha crystallin family protein [Desulfovibrio sp.]